MDFLLISEVGLFPAASKQSKSPAALLLTQTLLHQAVGWRQAVGWPGPLCEDMGVWNPAAETFPDGSLAVGPHGGLGLVAVGLRLPLASASSLQTEVSVAAGPSLRRAVGSKQVIIISKLELSIV